MKPFLKWAGGKRQLLPHLLHHTPQDIVCYYEPFLGGGALFFELFRSGRIKHAVLSDSNEELINTYRAVRDFPLEVIAALEAHAALHAEDYYYAVRSQRPSTLPEVAARMIYLNRTCFNGLYRTNNKGGFNSPWGKAINPKICDRKTLMEASEALQCAKLLCASWEVVMSQPVPGDFVYFDPPYLPKSKTANFTAYTAKGFGMDKHEHLLRGYKQLHAEGVAVLLSNADTPEARRLYRGCVVKAITARRAINSKASNRGPVGELLVLGVKPPRKTNG